jgi:hypothetical protein
MADDEKQDEVKEVVVKNKANYMRPSECRSHMRRTLSREFDAIVKGFVEAAKKGSCPHVKLAVEMMKPDRKGPSRKKGSATKYWEKLQAEQRERERLEREQLDAELVPQGIAVGFNNEY